jgi:hypothetical protein
MDATFGVLSSRRSDVLATVLARAAEVTFA